MLKQNNVDISQMLIGDIYKIMLKSLEKLCSYHQSFHKFLKNSKKYDSACIPLKGLMINCKDEKR